MLEEGETCYRVAAVSQTAVLVDARAYYAAVYAAAQRAQRHILIAGWQFDTEVELVRGDDAAGAVYPTQLVPFLDALCCDRPELHVYILAWEYSVVYALEREWLQGVKLAFQRSGRVRWEFAAHPGFGGSHHQKFVVIDGALGFVGGMDICDERWDDCQHLTEHPLRRNLSGEPCRPNHEVQTAISGPAVSVLSQVFCARWRSACGEDLRLDPEWRSPDANFDLSGLTGPGVFSLRAERVGIARTLPASDDCGAVQEVKKAYGRAILAAQHSIYIETQYFTSRTMTAALVRRFADAAAPRLQVVVMLPLGADNPKEKLALGDLQSAMLGELQRAAALGGHRLWLLSSVSHADGTTQEPVATFIHSKVLVVDDEFLGIGSANFTERSMGYDSELNLLWQAGAGSALEQDIRQLRAALLSEHSGHSAELLLDPEGLGDRIDEWLRTGRSRLRSRRYERAEPSRFQSRTFDPGGPDRVSQVDPATFEIESFEDLHGGRFQGGNAALRRELERRSRLRSG